jgi:hypothetical protein
MVNGLSGEHYVIDPGLTMCDIWATWHKHEIENKRIDLRQEKRRDTYTKKTVCKAFGYRHYIMQLLDLWRAHNSRTIQVKTNVGGLLLRGWRRRTRNRKPVVRRKIGRISSRWWWIICTTGPPTPTHT